MESIKDILIGFCNEHLDENNDWYTWKIDNDSIPKNVILQKGNNFAKNISLKQQLHSMWNNAKNIQVKGDLIEYYINKWGGIKSNRVNTLDLYKTSSANVLISRGIKGIASWSKALVLHDWNKFAIFDARVSCTINILQIMSNSENKILFPVLASRNKLIIAANSKIKVISKKENWTKISNKNFYNNYLLLLASIAKELDTNISTIEMLLFSKAEEVVNKSKLIK